MLIKTPIFTIKWKENLVWLYSFLVSCTETSTLIQLWGLSQVIFQKLYGTINQNVKLGISERETLFLETFHTHYRKFLEKLNKKLNSGYHS
jgi:hypothetical protein